jgi:hypothetical protein
LITAKVISKTNNGASRSINTKRKFLASQCYTGAINGIDVTKNLMVDPSISMNVVHFMLLKPAVIQIAEEVNNDGQAAASDGLMEFSLTPSTKRLIMMDRQQLQMG